MIGTGTAPVRIEMLSGPSPSVGNFTVQVGAFTDRTNAERLRERLLARYQPIFIQDFDAPNGHFYRVRRRPCSKSRRRATPCRAITECRRIPNIRSAA